MENKTLKGSQEEEDMKKILDEELEHVSGGFMETQDVPTKGLNIICPQCNNDLYILDGLYYDKTTGSVEYRCKIHGSFVCYDKNVVNPKDWKNLCDEKGIKY